VLLVLGIREPARQPEAKRVNPVTRENLKKLSRGYWWVVGVGAVFTLARFSEAFLVLRAMQAGIPIALVPLVLVTMNVVYALSAYPFGKLADSMSHTKLLAAGLVVLIASDIVLANGNSWPVMTIGVALWAFGFFNLMSGLAMLVASVVAGELWDRFGASTTFYAGAGFCIATLFALAASKTTLAGKT
jgi:MFS family permease